MVARQRKDKNEPANFLRVLTYHRVANIDPASPLSPQLISATVAGFARQMAFVSQHYNAVSMEQVLAAVTEGKRLPRKAVIITFDDGYYDLKTNAFPVLRHFNLPATIFVPTAYPGNPEMAFWWDRLYEAVMFGKRQEYSGPAGNFQLTDADTRFSAVRQLQNYVKTLPHDTAMNFIDEISDEMGIKRTKRKTVMDWDELRKMARNNITLAAHTQTHPLLNRISLDDVRKEAVGSREDLRREIGEVLPVFSYPNGNHNDDIVKVLGEENFQLGFTCLDGHSNLNTIDPLRLCRTDITRKTSPLLFRLRLMRLFTYIDKWRHR